MGELEQFTILREGVGIQSKVARSKYTYYKKIKLIEFKLNDGTFNNYQ